MTAGKTIILFLAGIMLSLPSTGADFSAYNIPKELRENAVAVMRLYEEHIDIGRDHNTTRQVREVVTVLTAPGSGYGYNYIPYDQFSKIRSVKATLYDADGEKVETFRSNDFTDRSAISGFSIYEDNRIMYLQPHHHSLPYTVEYEYTVDYSQSLFYPTWYPQPAEEVSTEKAIMTINAPEKGYFRYKEMNLPEGSAVKLSTDKGKLS